MRLANLVIFAIFPGNIDVLYFRTLQDSDEKDSGESVSDLTIRRARNCVQVHGQFWQTSSHFTKKFSGSDRAMPYTIPGFVIVCEYEISSTDEQRSHINCNELNAHIYSFLPCFPYYFGFVVWQAL